MTLMAFFAEAAGRPPDSLSGPAGWAERYQALREESGWAEAPSFERLVGGLRGQGLARPLTRMLASAAAMGALAWAAADRLELWLGARSLTARLVTCLVPVVVGVLAYGALTRALQVGEARTIGRVVLDKLRPRRRVLPS